MNMHGYVTGHYVPQHFTQMSEQPHDMTAGGRGQRTRTRGRGKRPEGVVDVPTPGYNQFVPIPTYHTGYYSPQVGPHPSAQHATGSPLYITPMYPPIYSAYAHGAQYYPPQAPHVGMMEDSVSPEIDLTVEQSPPQHHHHQRQPHHQYSPQLSEHEGFEAPPQTVIVNKNKDDHQEYIINTEIRHVILANIVKIEPEPVVEQHSNIIEKQQPQQQDRENIAKLKTEIPDPITPVNNIIIEPVKKIVKPPKVLIKSVTPEKVITATKIIEIPVETASINDNYTPVTEDLNKQVPEKQETIADNTEQKIPEPSVTNKSWGGGGKSWASLFNSGANQQQPTVPNFNISESGGKQPSFNSVNNSNGKSFFNNNTNKPKEEKLQFFPSLHRNNEAAFTPQRSSNNINNNNRIGGTNNNNEVHNTLLKNMFVTEFLSTYNLEFRTVSLQPRGLTNRSNYCYINSILQALLACPPFYNLLAALPHQRNRRKNSAKSLTPIIDSM